MGLFGFGKKKKQETQPVEPAAAAPVQKPAAAPAPKPAPAKEFVDVPPAGKVCRMDDITFITLTSKTDGKGARRWQHLSVRELRSGEVGTLLVGWNTDVASPVYTTTYWTDTYRSGAEKQSHEIHHDERDIYYEIRKKNVRFEVLGGELRMCRYLGDGICEDFFSGTRHSFKGQTAVEQELAQIHRGDVVSVCLYEGRAYFGGSYVTQDEGIYQYCKTTSGGTAFFKVGASGTIKDLENVHLFDGEKISSEKPELDAYYRYISAVMLNRQINHRYEIWGSPVSIGLLIPAPSEGKCAYGYLTAEKGVVAEIVTFTDAVSGSTYRVNPGVVSKKMTEVLLKEPRFICAKVFDTDPPSADLDHYYETEYSTLSYAYPDGDVASCIDMDTYEMIEIPVSQLPEGIEEGDTFFCFYAKSDELKDLDATGLGMLCYTRPLSDEERAAVSGDDEETETVYTYEGRGADGQHILRCTEGDDVKDFTYADDAMEFAEEGIIKGTRVNLKLRFDDATCTLIATLTKFK